MEDDRSSSSGGGGGWSDGHAAAARELGPEAAARAQRGERGDGGVRVVQLQCSFLTGAEAETINMALREQRGAGTEVVVAAGLHPRWVWAQGPMSDAD